MLSRISPIFIAKSTVNPPRASKSSLNATNLSIPVLLSSVCHVPFLGCNSARRFPWFTTKSPKNPLTFSLKSLYDTSPVLGAPSPVGYASESMLCFSATDPAAILSTAAETRKEPAPITAVLQCTPPSVEPSPLNTTSSIAIVNNAWPNDFKKSLPRLFE